MLSIPAHDARRWAKDAAVSKCLACEAPFTVILRRHHCRSCGEIFCEPCCKQTAILPGPSDAKSSREKVRMCNSCFTVCEKAFAKAQETLQAAGSGAVGGVSLDVAAYAWYWTLMCSASGTSLVVRKQRAMTKAKNHLVLDVGALRDEIKKAVASPTGSGGGGASGASGRSGPNSGAHGSPTLDEGPRSPRAALRVSTRSNAAATEDVESVLASTTTFGLLRGAAAATEGDGTSPAAGLASFFDAGSTSKIRQLESRLDRLTTKAVSTLRILERHSLTCFYLHMYGHLCELLMKSFLSSLGVSTHARNTITEAQHHKSIRRLQLHGLEVNLAASAALARTVLHLESLRMPWLAASTSGTPGQPSGGGSAVGELGAQPASHNLLPNSMVGCELLDDIAEQLAVAITIRYEEQICCLTEGSATILAITAAARIHHRVHAHATSSEEDFTVLLNHVTLEDYIFDAVLNERPTGVQEQSLQTRLRDVDAMWTDHGALSCCGLATPEGLYFDPVYLASAAETSSKIATTRGHEPPASVPTHSAVASSVASKYYYRHGTLAEALAMKMTPTGKARHAASPLWSAQMLYDEHQLLSRRREELLSSYSRVPFCDLHSNSWVSWLGSATTPTRQPIPSTATVQAGTSPQECGSTATSFTRRVEAVSFRVDVLRNAVRLCKDYIANPEALRQLLITRYRTYYQELETITHAMQESKLRSQDIQNTPQSSSEAQGLLAAIERITALNKSQHVQQRVSAFHRFHSFLNPTTEPTPVALFYLHMRTKLLMTLLSASRTELQDDPVTLMGAVVPYSPRVAIALDAMYARASRNDLYKSWWLPDIVDLHTERIARILADRFRDTVDILSPASTIVFADCCVARLLYLYAHYQDEATLVQSLSREGRKGNDSFIGKAGAGGAGGGSGFDWLLEVTVVERMERVHLFDTIVTVEKVYLTTADHKSCITEHGIHTKSGLCAADGTWYAGARETHGDQLMHHRGPKYGIIYAFPGEIERKKLHRASADWSLDLAGTAAQKKKSRISFFGGGGATVAAVPPLIKPPPKPSDVVHWGSCLLSVGPRLVGPGEIVGVTLLTKTKSGADAVLSASQRSQITFYALTGEEGRLAPGAGAAQSSPSPSDGATAVQAAVHKAPTDPRLPEGAIVESFQCATAGVLILAAALDNKLLIGNSVRVRPGRVDWPRHCSVDVSPKTAVAGETVVVTMTLRDEYNNVSSTTTPEDFSVSIDNAGTAVVASSVTEEVEGKYKFVFVPTNEGPIYIVITAAGVSLTCGGSDAGAQSPQLRCIAGPPDFKNSMFSFDEWDVVAGTTVHGNLLLRDVYGNKVEAEDERPLVEMINGGTTVIPVQRVHRGEYLFSFCPTKQGCAILRATSLRSFASLIARVNVEAPKEVDWSRSSISCLSKVLFAGEVAEFHIVMRDEFGNSISSDAKPVDFSCWLRYVDSEDSVNASKAILTSSVAAGEGTAVSLDEAQTGKCDSTSRVLVVKAAVVTGSGASFAFRVTPGAIGNVIACASFRGGPVVLESLCMQVRSAPLDWPSSVIHVEETAAVGEWVPVLIECRDRFRNVSEAQESDFSVVAYHDSSTHEETIAAAANSSTSGGASPQQLNPPTVKTKPVSGAGSQFAFQVLCTRSGVLRIVVTYAGYLKHECSVRLLPQPVAWATTELSAMPLSASGTPSLSPMGLPFLVAGDVLRIVVLFRDPYGNWTHRPQHIDALVLSVDNEGTVTQVEPSSEVDDDTESGWCRAVFYVHPKVAGRVNVSATWKRDSSSEVKQARATVVPNVIDWDCCTFTSVGASVLRATAGTVVAARIKLVDSFLNPVEAATHAVHVRACNATTDHRDATAELMCDVRIASFNELLLQCTPQLSGALDLSVDMNTEREPYREAIVGATKTLLYEVTPAGLDWTGRTVVGVPPDGAIVAGRPFEITLHLRDPFDNPIFGVDWEKGAEVVGAGFHVAFLEAKNPTTYVPRREACSLVADEAQDSEGRFTPSLSGQGREGEGSAQYSPQEGGDPSREFRWFVASRERGVLTGMLTAYVAGQSTLHIRCPSQANERPSLALAVHPAAAVWARTEILWATQYLSVGVAGTLTLRWRDAYGNLTSHGCPRPSRISTSFQQRSIRLEPAQSEWKLLTPERTIPQDRQESFPVLDNYVVQPVTDIAGVAQLTVVLEEGRGGQRGFTSDGGHEDSDLDAHDDVNGVGNRAPLYSPPITVHAAAPSANSSLVLVPNGGGLRRAGTVVEYLLTFRDRFNNDCAGYVTNPVDDLRLQLLLGGTAVGKIAVRPVTAAAGSNGNVCEDAKSACHFLLSFTPTAMGEYTVSAGLKRESEAYDLMETIVVCAAEVSWLPANTRLYADSESVVAGASIFCQLECRDRFNNASSFGFNTSRLSFRMTLSPPWSVSSSPSGSAMVNERDTVSAVLRSGDHDARLGARVHDVIQLPQQDGLYGFTVEVSVAGSLAIAIERDGEQVGASGTGGASLRMDDVVDVRPAAPSWEKCSLIPLRTVVKAGDTASFGLVLRDTYGNTINPFQRPPDAAPPAGASPPAANKRPGPAGAHSASPTAVAKRTAESSERSELARGQSQDDLGEDLLVQDLASDAAYVTEFHRSEVPLLRALCECTNTDHQSSEWTVLESMPREHRQTSARVAPVLVGGDQAGPAPPKAAEMRFAVMFHATPTIAGNCVLRLTHEHENAVHVAPTVKVHPSKPEKAQAVHVSAEVRAGDTTTFTYRLRDRFDNWIIAPAQLAPVAERVTLQCVWESTHRDLVVVDDCEERVGKVVPGFTWKIECTAGGLLAAVLQPTLAGNVKVVLLSTDGLQLLANALAVRPSRLSARQSVVNVLAGVGGAKVAAGEPLRFTVTAMDEFGNVIPDARQELVRVTDSNPEAETTGTTAAQTAAKLYCRNGTSRPDITELPKEGQGGTGVVAPIPHHVLVYEVIPGQLGTLSIVLLDAAGEKKATNPLPIAAAPLHWPSCTVRLSDPSVSLGATTNLLIAIKDRFLNAVDGDSCLFRIDVLNGGRTFSVPVAGSQQHAAAAHASSSTVMSEVEDRSLRSMLASDAEDSTHGGEAPMLPECEGILVKRGRTLLCEIKPVLKGTLQCRVTYVGDVESDAKLSNVVEVE